MSVWRQSCGSKGCLWFSMPLPSVASLRFWAVRMSESGNDAWTRSDSSSQSWRSAGNLEIAENSDGIARYRWLGTACAEDLVAGVWAQPGSS